MVAVVLSGMLSPAIGQIPGAQGLRLPSTGSASSPSVSSMSNEDLQKQYCELQHPTQSGSSSNSMMSSLSSTSGMTDAAKQAAMDKMKTEVADELNRRSIKLPGCG